MLLTLYEERVVILERILILFTIVGSCKSRKYLVSSSTEIERVLYCTHFTLPWCNSSSNKNRILYHSINKWFTCPQASWRNKVKVRVKLNRLYITIYRKCIKSQSWSNTTFVHSLPFAFMDTVNPAIYNMFQKMYILSSTCFSLHCGILSTFLLMTSWELYW